MITFLLVRHGMTDVVGSRISGRLPHVSLNQMGRDQAQRLAEVLSREPIQKIYCSPLERACETALPLARRLGLIIEISEELNEVDFGDWTDRSFDELESLGQWKQFNALRSWTRIPNGELIVEVQGRIIRKMERIWTELPNGTAALFSHGDVIKSAIAYFQGTPLDLLTRIEVKTASVTALALGDGPPRILYVDR